VGTLYQVWSQPGAGVEEVDLLATVLEPPDQVLLWEFEMLPCDFCIPCLVVLRKYFCCSLAARVAFVASALWP
jgi:hypothetical protein